MDGFKSDRSISAFTLPEPTGDSVLESVPAAPSIWEVARAVESLSDLLNVVGEEVAALRGELAAAGKRADDATNAQANLISEIRGLVYRVRDDLARQVTAHAEHAAGHLTSDDLSKSHANCVTPSDLKRVADAMETAIHQQVAQVDPVAALRAKMRGTA